jgi:hypothetical protein
MSFISIMPDVSGVDIDERAGFLRLGEGGVRIDPFTAGSSSLVRADGQSPIFDQSTVYFSCP